MSRSIHCFFVAIVLAAVLSGCGYTLQTSKSPLTENEGIRKIYVAPLVNNTYSPGVENTLYNALLQTVSVHRRVILVNRPELADAVLRGNVSLASYGASALAPASQLQPSSLIPNADPRGNILVATEYYANLACDFSLVRQNPRPGQNAMVWASAFSRSKPFAAANQIGTQGDTSALINESEFQRAIGDLARAMMDDVHESMLAMF